MAPFIKKINLNYLKSIIALANRPDLFDKVLCGAGGRMLVKQCDHEGVTGDHQKVYVPLDVGSNLSLLGYILDLGEDVTIHGDLDFDGTAGHGMVQGEISSYNVAIPLTSVNQNDWNQILAFTVNNLSNRCVPDHTQDHINISSAGRYRLFGRWTGYGPNAAHDWDTHFRLNNGATTIDTSVGHFKTSNATDHTQVTWQCDYELAMNDTVEMWVERYSAGNNIVLTTIGCNLSVLKIGA